MSSQQPSYPLSRPNLTSIAAACILSGGLITAAIIDSHRPVVTPTAPTVATAAVAALPVRATPPIAQDSARQQFEAQVANQKFATLRQDGVDYSYKGVRVTEVDYSAKDDALTFIYVPLWQSSTGADSSGLESISSASASNDGYGHYTGGANLGGTGDDFRYVPFTIR